MPTQPTKSLTPETDAFEFESIRDIPVTDTSHWYSTAVKMSNFARSLELRLNAALAENEELRKDKERLDWLETNLDRYDVECNLAAIAPFWFTRGHGHKVIAFAQGKDLRQAIDSAIQSTNKPK